MTQYRQRPHAFAPERTYTLAADGVHCQGEGELDTVIRYDQVESVRLAFEPTRAQRNRYCLRITGRQGQRYDITNEHYAGIAEFEDRSPGYRHFAAELHRLLASGGYPARFHSGQGAMQYAFNCALTIFILVMLAGVAWFLLAVGLIAIVVVKVVIIAFYLPTLFRYVTRNRPQDYLPSAIPPAVLPPLPEASSRPGAT